jgi:hypothetical protein
VVGGGTGLARGKDREWNRSEVWTKLDRDDGEGQNRWLLPTVAFSSSHSTLRQNEIELEHLVLSV